MPSDGLKIRFLFRKRAEFHTRFKSQAEYFMYHRIFSLHLSMFWVSVLRAFTFTTLIELPDLSASTETNGSLGSIPLDFVRAGIFPLYRTLSKFLLCFSLEWKISTGSGEQSGV